MDHGRWNYGGRRRKHGEKISALKQGRRENRRIIEGLRMEGKEQSEEFEFSS